MSNMVVRPPFPEKVDENFVRVWALMWTERALTEVCTRNPGDRDGHKGALTQRSFAHSDVFGEICYYLISGSLYFQDFWFKTVFLPILLPFFLPFFLFIFIIEVQLTNNIVLVSGVQHVDSTILYIMQYSAKCSHYLSPYNVTYWLYSFCCTFHIYGLLIF